RLRRALADVPMLEMPFKDASPFILSFVLAPVPSDVILRHLEEQDIILSSTSACSSRIQGKNPVLAALGLPEEKHKQVLRVSLSQESTEDEVDRMVAALKSVHAKLYALYGKK